MGTHNGGAEVTDDIWNLDPSLDHGRLGHGRAAGLASHRPRADGGDDDPKDPTHEPSEGDDVELEDKPISATPRRYKVIFHNDDYTTMEFVVEVLKRFFHKTDTEAMHIMLTVHKSGAAVAGVFTRDVAETKKAQVLDYARENGMPLLLTTEPE
jgi:ATP-dependent Clp protease adaptor protein ClpS